MTLTDLYGLDAIERQQARYQNIKEKFNEQFGAEAEYIFSAPGRSEICGNHTDHNMGKVMAAAIDLDIVAAVSPRNDNCIVIHSDKFSGLDISIDSTDVVPDEVGTSAGIVRGIVAKMKADGYTVGGFSVYNESDVLKGSGMSSSAAFEILICTILSGLYNNDRLDPVEAAKISKYAENVYFGKPSGLMDQMACSVGGFVKIDFADEQNPVITPIPFDFAATGYSLIITDCHADHADATDDYASIRADMAAVSEFFGKANLREVDEKEFVSRMGEVRAACGDVPMMRAMHFFSENRLVDQAADALILNDFQTFKKSIIASGRSSYMYLQNIYSPSDPRAQALALALCVSEKMLAGIGGAWRVHGGGFGGTIQAFVPMAAADQYVDAMEKLFGKDCCFRVSVRPVGGCAL